MEHVTVQKIKITNPEEIDDTLLSKLGWTEKPQENTYIDMAEEPATLLVKAGAAKRSSREEQHQQFINENTEELFEKATAEYEIGELRAIFNDHDTTKQKALSIIAEHLMTKHNFKTLRDNEITWKFQDGVYKRTGEQTIREYIHTHFNDLISKYDADEIFEQIKYQTLVDRNLHGTHAHIIPCTNGWYNVKKDELQQPNPEKFIINQLNVAYKPNATCPRIMDFLHDIVDEENIPLLQEWAGYCLYRKYPIHRAVMLVGQGGNGKSQFIDLIQKMVGESNVANPSLQDLTDDRFAKAELYGKLVNLHADLSNKKLTNSGPFKMLCGGDLIRGERKYQEPFKFHNYAKLMYSANQLPRTTDNSDAFWRRWITINFPYQFVDEPEAPHEKKKQEGIIDHITTEEEMQGFLRWSIEGLQRVLDNGQFTHTKSREETKTMWLTQSNPLKVFLDRHVTVDYDSYESKDDFYEAYQEFCMRHNAPVDAKNHVSRKINQEMPQSKARQKRIGGDRVRVWDNLVVDYSPDETKVSQVSQVKSYPSHTREEQPSKKEVSKSTCDTCDDFINFTGSDLLSFLDQEFDTDSDITTEKVLRCVHNDALKERVADMLDPEIDSENLYQNGELLEKEPGVIRRLK